MRPELPANLHIIRGDDDDEDFDISSDMESKKRIPHAEWLNDPLAWNEKDFIKETSELLFQLYGNSCLTDRHLLGVLANEIVIDVLKQENNDQEIYQKYVSKEKELLKYLQTNSRITTEEYSAILNLSHRRTRCILVSLVLSGIIELHATEKELFFTAS